MASTTNNSGLDGNPEDEFGPNEKYDDETDAQFADRMRRKKEFELLQAEARKNAMPPCIG